MNESHSRTGALDARTAGSHAMDHGRASRGMMAAFATVAVAAAIVAVTALRFAGSGGSGDVRADPAVIASQSNAGAEPSEQAARDAWEAGAKEWEANVESERLRAEAAARVQHDEFVRRFRSEAVDARWAATKEAALISASSSPQIAELGAEPRSLDIDCRSSICRVQADFAVESSAQDWVTLFLLNAGSQIPRSVFDHSVNPDRTIRVELYGYSRSPEPTRPETRR